MHSPPLMPSSQRRSANPATRLAELVTSRRGKWLVLVLWIALVAAVSPIAGKLGDIEENDDAAWLPAGAESLQVSELLADFPASDTMPGVIVYAREGGLTDADRATIERHRTEIGARFPEAPPAEPVFSQDGRAALVTVPLRNDDMITGRVNDIRDMIATEGGLNVAVTGPAGFITDLAGVFDGADEALLFGAAAVVIVLLLLTYRSPVLWTLPLIAVGVALQVANAGVYGLATRADITVNGQSGGILPVLVFGVGTDYALLLIARYREELRRHDDHHAALAVALRQAGPAILASAGTVTAGLLCLLAAGLTSTESLGAVGAAGVLAALLALLTLLPALLAIVGRHAFWPLTPRVTATHVAEERKLWTRLGWWIERRPRPIWVGSALVLALLAVNLIGVDTNLSQMDQFRSTPEAISGQKTLAEHFPAGASAPADVIARGGSAEVVGETLSGVPGVVDVRQVAETSERVLLSVTLAAEPSSQEAFRTVERMRGALDALPEAEALVGGNDAESLDIATTTSRDRLIVMPLVLLVVLLILGLLLRAVVAPVMLIATVVLSFGASLGLTSLISKHVFGFPALEASVPLLGFVFLVALGIDYNIFLMSRIHEEAHRLGTDRGTLRGLAATGGVITAAGVVLAATFVVLAVLPLVSMTQVGVLVAIGVLIDTLLVRSVLVPALTLELSDRVWWPSRPELRRSAVEATPAGTTIGLTGVNR